MVAEGRKSRLGVERTRVFPWNGARTSWLLHGARGSNVRGARTPAGDGVEWRAGRFRLFDRVHVCSHEQSHRLHYPSPSLDEKEQIPVGREAEPAM